MGFRVRKQLRFGGIRVNLSKSGASLSTKVGPITVNSRGRQTVHLAPGVSYQVGTRRAARTAADRRPATVPVSNSRSMWVAYALTVFLGFTGAQHFYLGYRGRGRAYACTLGFLGLGWLWDMFAIGFEVHRVNAALASSA